MTAFDTAVDVLHADPHLSVTGTFTAPPALGLAVRVILTRHDPEVQFGGLTTSARSAGWEASLKQADIPTRPRQHVDTITTTLTGVRVIGDVEEDAEHTVWVCDLGG